LNVGQKRIGAVLEEEVNYIIVTALSGPHGWCCYRITTFGVNVGTIVQQELAHGVLIIDRGPL
jgi:hypothetical protein